MLLLPAPKATPRTRSGPGRSVGVFWHGFAWNGFFPKDNSVFQGRAPQEALERRESAAGRRKRLGACVLRPILPEEGSRRGQPRLIFDGVDLNLSLHKAQRGARAGGFQSGGVIYPWESEGRGSSTPCEHNVPIQPGLHGKAPPKEKEGIKEAQEQIRADIGNPKNALGNTNKEARQCPALKSQSTERFWKAQGHSSFGFFSPKDLQCLGKKTKNKNPKPTKKGSFCTNQFPWAPSESGAENWTFQILINAH